MTPKDIISVFGINPDFTKFMPVERSKYWKCPHCGRSLIYKSEVKKPAFCICGSASLVKMEVV